jgi:hypothetical protein
MAFVIAKMGATSQALVLVRVRRTRYSIAGTKAAYHAVYMRPASEMASVIVATAVMKQS